MTTKLHTGQTVLNLGVIAKVEGFHEITGDPILRPLYNDGTRWLADAAKCRPLEETDGAWRHEGGLVSSANPKLLKEPTGSFSFGRKYIKLS